MVVNFKTIYTHDMLLSITPDGHPGSVRPFNDYQEKSMSIGDHQRQCKASDLD